MLNHPDPKEHLRQRGWDDNEHALREHEHGTMWGREAEVSVLLSDDGTMHFFGYTSVDPSDVYALALIAAGAGQGECVAAKPKVDLSSVDDLYMWKEFVKQLINNGQRMQQAIDEADLYIVAMQQRCKTEGA